MYLTPESKEILAMLTLRGDTRGRSEIYNECLKIVYGSMLAADMDTIMLNAMKSYANRQLHLKSVKDASKEDYKNIQVAWLNAPERFGKFRLIFEDCSPLEIFNILERTDTTKFLEEKSNIIQPKTESTLEGGS